MINPESPSSAREWDKTKAHYMRLGLDSRCAAQAAYGSQDGFSTVRPPCAECLSIVATFPTNEPGPWRSHSRRHGKAIPRSMPSLHPA
ncbi:hypothetical protein IWX62_003235 [Arthrobacter sp. CAN_A1]